MTRVLMVEAKVCPIPLVELQKTLALMESVEEIEVRATDPCFEKDIGPWCKKTGNTLVSLRKEGDTFVAIVRKGNGGDS